MSRNEFYVSLVVLYAVILGVVRFILSRPKAERKRRDKEESSNDPNGTWYADFDRVPDLSAKVKFWERVYFWCGFPLLVVFIVVGIVLPPIL